jgi:hypothetical protein
MTLKPILFTLGAGVFALPAIAEDAHHPEEKIQAPAKPAAGMPADMKRMQEQMAQIRASTDPKERQRLMGEHMKTMQESMGKMSGMMGGGKSMEPGQRMQMMERRMDMMQMMMQQMMEHEAAEKSPAK